MENYNRAITPTLLQLVNYTIRPIMLPGFARKARPEDEDYMPVVRSTSQTSYTLQSRVSVYEVNLDRQQC